MTTIAAKVMAAVLFGHSVTVQKNSAAPITTNVPPAFDKGNYLCGCHEAQLDRG